MPEKILSILGPTASGKTELALYLAQHFPVEIISVDSAMIYREMDIGTAKPSENELALAPHHLINLINPNENYSAALFCQDVKKKCKEIRARGKKAFVNWWHDDVFSRFTKGLSSLPEGDKKLRSLLEKKDLNDLYEELNQKDPERAKDIDKQDKQRILRALEVFYLCGKPLSDLYKLEKNTEDYRFINLALFPEKRSWLHDRIALRFESMLSQGFLQEVEKLIQKWQIDASYPAFKTVGYRQAFAYLKGECDYASFKEKALAATRQLAKRQLTWLRSWEGMHKMDPSSLSLDKMLKEIIEIGELDDRN